MKAAQTAIFGGLLVLVASAAWSAADQTISPTFTKDVLPILQERCQDCHREGSAGIAGMFAPMALTSYAEVRPWAKAIARAVRSKAMPPWDATDVTLGQFSNERVMTADERETVIVLSRVHHNKTSV